MLPIRFDISVTSLPSTPDDYGTSLTSDEYRWYLDFYPVEEGISVATGFRLMLGPAPAEELRAG